MVELQIADSSDTNLSHDDVRRKIEHLEASSIEMRAKRQHAKMLRCMEEALSLRVTHMGREDPEVQSAAQKLVKDYNSVAMQLLREGEEIWGSLCSLSSHACSASPHQ